jgi:deoxyribodipyrimidine photo-lyase
MKTAVVWFRRDLRLEDNRALQGAVATGQKVLPLFVFDSNILEELPADDPRVSFIYERLEKIHRKLRSLGSSLLVKYGEPLAIWKEILRSYEISGVHINKDYEPYASERDVAIEQLLRGRGISLHRYKDQVIFEENEIMKKDGTPYTVFTPYKRKWLEQLDIKSFPEDPPLSSDHFLPIDNRFPDLTELGFKHAAIRVKPHDLTNLNQYAKLRDYPALDATSRLSPHLRFGTISIRQVIRKLDPAHEPFLSELIWREFFMQILYHFPQVVDQNFKPRYNGIRWRNNEKEFERWCKGETGYPLVDAGMRQLKETGIMHNRVRMVTASFLCKHLLIDWRWGEAYFASKLLDFELSSNNGNWQWAAGTGCDAAPYFRIFNPYEQQKKFDKKLEYVRKWLPEYEVDNYIQPMVDHPTARTRALQEYKNGIDRNLP